MPKPVLFAIQLVLFLFFAFIFLPVERVSAQYCSDPASVTLDPPVNTCAGPRPAITLNWSGGSGATSYRIQRRIGNGSWSSIDEVGSSMITYTDTSVYPDVSYSYRIQSRNACGRSFSNTVSAVALECLPPPSKPTVTTACIVNSSTNYVAWTNSQPPASGFNIYRANLANYSSPAFTPNTGNLASGLVAYYKMDETSGASVNSSLPGNLGTSSSSVNIITSGQKLGSAARTFNGTTNYIDLGDDPSISFGASNFTYSVWVKTTSTSNMFVMGENDDEDNDYNLRDIRVNNRVVEFQIRSDQQSQRARIVGTKNVADGAWHHIVGIRKNNTIYLYIDGVLDGQSTNNTVGNTNSISTNTTIGRMDTLKSNKYYFNGTIDEVGMWFRDLTSREIADLYNGGAGNSYNGPVLTITQVGTGVPCCNFTDNNAVDNSVYTYQLTGLSGGQESNPSQWSDWIQTGNCDTTPPNVALNTVIGAACYTASSWDSIQPLSASVTDPESTIVTTFFTLKNLTSQVSRSYNASLSGGNWIANISSGEFSGIGGYGLYELSVSARNSAGLLGTYTHPNSINYAAGCTQPWIQTRGGDVHSNTIIKTPGGP